MPNIAFSLKFVNIKFIIKFETIKLKYNDVNKKVLKNIITIEKRRA
jgi:hypothetical protein